MQLSITVALPNGSSGLNAPMRLERPAASRMAATWCVSSLLEWAIYESGSKMNGVRILASSGWLPIAKPESLASFIYFLRLKRTTPARKTFSPQRSKCADRILPRHLLAPTVDKVSVVERPRLNVRRFGGRANLIIVEWLPDQRLR